MLMGISLLSHKMVGEGTGKQNILDKNLCAKPTSLSIYICMGLPIGDLCIKTEFGIMNVCPTEVRQLVVVVPVDYLFIY